MAKPHRQTAMDLMVVETVAVEPIVDLPRCYRVWGIVEHPQRDYLCLNPIISHLPAGKQEKPENVVTTEYFFLTLKVAVLAGQMKWPGRPVHIERDIRRCDRPSTIINHDWTQTA